MTVYTIAIIPLIVMMVEITNKTDSTTKTAAYADDITVTGKLAHLKYLLNILCELGPKLEYYLEASISWFIVKESAKHKATTIFKVIKLKNLFCWNALSWCSNRFLILLINLHFYMKLYLLSSYQLLLEVSPAPLLKGNYYMDMFINIRPYFDEFWTLTYIVNKLSENCLSWKFIKIFWLKASIKH